jgi:capsular polysaccharide export protein
MAREDVTDLIVFGDSHPYCAGAIDEACRQNVRVHVLEEGYFRPNWVTLERGGVNGCSRLPRDPQAYRWAAARQPPRQPAVLGSAHAALTMRIFLYFLGFYAGLPFFSAFKQPYAYSPLRQGIAHVRKYGARRLSAMLGKRRPAPAADRYFLVLLQRPGDSQIVRHSPFRTVADMIDVVMSSFARHAPQGARLVIKGHPLDHGIERHDLQIDRVASALGVQGRVAFVDDAPLGGLLEAALGVVTVNSTGGLTALELGKPTIALGQAIYDLPGLAHQGGLDGFWSAPQAPDPTLFEGFRRTVIALTQVNGAFASSKGAHLAAEGVARRLLQA